MQYFQGTSPSDHEDENDPDGQFAFRRRRNCNYFAVCTHFLDQAYHCILQGDKNIQGVNQIFMFCFELAANFESPWELALA